VDAQLNNFNDFIVVELTLTNTGNLDINCDGTAEKTNNVIRALTLMTGGEVMCSYTLGRNGGRGNQFGAQRVGGYVGDNDRLGAPGLPRSSILARARRVSRTWV